MSTTTPTHDKLVEQQILLTQQQIKNERELHCIIMLKKYRKVSKHFDNEDEKELFHNLCASIFLELKELRNVVHH